MITCCAFYSWGEWRLVKIVCIRVRILYLFKARFWLLKHSLYIIILQQVYLKHLLGPKHKYSPIIFAFTSKLNVFQFRTLPQRNSSEYKSLINCLWMCFKRQRIWTLFLPKTGSASSIFFFYRSICFSNQNSVDTDYNIQEAVGHNTDTDYNIQ